jgi:uncharacterized membrane protein YqjE
VLVLVLAIRLPTALLALLSLVMLVMRLPAVALLAPLSVLVIPLLALPVPGLAGMLVMSVLGLVRVLLIAGWGNYQARRNLKSFRARTHRLLLKPEGRQLDSRTLLPLWQRVQLLVLPVAYT